MSVDVMMFDRDELVDTLFEWGCTNRDVVEEVLDMFGETVCDKYIILINDHYAEDSMFLLCRTLEKLFDIEDALSSIYDIDFKYIGGGGADYNWEDENKVFALAVQLKTAE